MRSRRTTVKLENKRELENGKVTEKWKMRSGRTTVKLENKRELENGKVKIHVRRTRNKK